MSREARKNKKVEKRTERDIRCPLTKQKLHKWQNRNIWGMVECGLHIFLLTFLSSLFYSQKGLDMMDTNQMIKQYSGTALTIHGHGVQPDPKKIEKTHTYYTLPQKKLNFPDVVFILERSVGQ